MATAPRINDNLTNVITGLGTSADHRTGRFYVSPVLSAQEIVATYRGSGLMRKVIDIPALDCVRNWREWSGDADAIEKIENEEKRLALRTKIKLAEIYRGLGGGAIILGLPGDAASPVPETGKSKIAFAHVVTRWQLTLGDEDMDYESPSFGGPVWYDLQSEGRSQRIHPSRVIPFTGDPIPHCAGVSWQDRFWGESRVSVCKQAVANLDDALANFSALPARARSAFLGIPGLTEFLSTSAGTEAITRRAQNFVTSESLFGVTLYDMGREGQPAEKIEHRQISWSGIPEMIVSFAEALAAVSDIPMTRLWGRAPEGMNSSGDSQQLDWAKMVNAKQEFGLRSCLEVIDRFMLPSIGITEPMPFTFASLQDEDDKGEADRFNVFTQAVDRLVNTNLVPERALSESLSNTLSMEKGWLSGFADALAKVPESDRLPFSEQLEEGGDPDLAALGDAALRTLYVSRPVLNADELQKWADEQGLGQLQPDLHVTIAYSRAQIDWMKVDSEDWNQEADGSITIAPGGVRIVEPLGDRTAVLLFTSSRLSWRHQQIVNAGASHDYPDYQPHISLTGDPVDLAGVEPYRGIIRLGLEVFQEINQGAE